MTDAVLLNIPVPADLLAKPTPKPAVPNPACVVAAMPKPPKTPLTVDFDVVPRLPKRLPEEATKPVLKEP